MIRIENLSKDYGHVKAVKSISFSLADREIVGFLGANGAGKTTTLKMITGYLAPTSGTVFVDKKNINDHYLEIQKKIGYLEIGNTQITRNTSKPLPIIMRF